VAARASSLGPRGRRLWTALHKGVARDAATDVLIEEACRIADRLDQLDRLLRGDVDEWIRIELPSLDSVDLVMKVNPLLSEARQQAATLQRLVASLQTKPEPTKQGSDALDALIAARASGAAASEGQ